MIYERPTKLIMAETVAARSILREFSRSPRRRAFPRLKDRMNAMDGADPIWPDLNYSAWRETLATLHLWTQIVGKIRLALTPWLNHGWHAPLYVTARGLGTSPIPIGAETFEIEFDFVGHRLMVRTSRAPKGPFRSGRSRSPNSIARLSIFSREWALRSRSSRRRTKFRTRFVSRTTEPTPPMTPRLPIVSGARSSRPIASSSASAPGFSARRARCISFGAASILR